MAFVEDQIDDREHGVDSLRQLGLSRNLIRNSRVPDLVLRAHYALRKRRCRYEKGARYLFRRESAHGPERERNLCLDCQRRVTAREDESQSVVGNLIVIATVNADRDVRFQLSRYLRVPGVEPRTTPDVIYRTKASGTYQPGARIRRHAIDWPSLQSRGKGVVQRFFRNVEVA